MTDFATLRLDADTTGMVLSVDAMRDVQVEAKNTEGVVGGAMTGVGRGFKTAGTGARALESDARRVGGALAQMSQKAIGTQARIDAMFGSPSVARNRAADIQAYAAEMDALRAKFNPLFAASQQYEASLAEITRAERLGAISAMEAASARERAAAALRPATTQMVGFNGAVQAGTGYTANLAAQFNDIGIMLAAGQSPFQLAIQQGTQVSQVLNQMGGGVGALRALQAGFMSMVNPISLATVGIIGFGAAAAQWLMRGTEGAREFDDVMGDVWKSVSKVKDMMSAYSVDGIVELQKKYGELNASVVEFINLQTQAAKLEAMRKQQELIASMYDDMNTWTRTVEQNLARAFGKSVDEVGRLEYLLRQVQRARTFDEMQAALTAARAEALRLSGGLENAHGEGKTLLMRLIESEDAARQLATAAPRASWLNAAISGAQSLVDKLWEAVRAKAAATADGMVDAAGNPTQFGPGSAARRGPRRAPASPELTGSAPSYDGGGGALNPYASDLEALQQNLMGQTALTDKWYQDSLDILNDRRAAELLTKQEHTDLLFALDQQYALKKLQLDEATNNSEVEMRQRTVGLLANTLTALGQHSKAAAVAAVALNAAKSIKETIHHTAVAVMRAMAELGPIAGPPAAARIKAMGAVQVGLIAANAALSLGGGGGGRGGSVSAIGTSPTTQAPQLPTQTLNFTIENDQFGFGEGIIRQIVEQLNKASRNGSNIVATVSA